MKSSAKPVLLGILFAVPIVVGVIVSRPKSIDAEGVQVNTVTLHVTGMT